MINRRVLGISSIQDLVLDEAGAPRLLLLSGGVPPRTAATMLPTPSGWTLINKDPSTQNFSSTPYCHHSTGLTRTTQ